MNMNMKVIRDKTEEIREIANAVHGLAVILSEDLDRHGHEDVTPCLTPYHQSAVVIAIRHLSDKTYFITDVIDDVTEKEGREVSHG